MPRRPTTTAVAVATVDRVAPITALIDEKLEARAIEALEQALEAQAWVRAGVDAGGKRVYQEVPDHALRVAAACRLLEFRRGRPASTLNVNSASTGAGQGSPPVLADMMRRNPELVEKIALAYVAEARRTVAKNSAEVVVTPVNESSGGRPPAN